MADIYQDFKAAQRAGWAFFAPLQTMTTPPAARLVNHAKIRAGQRVLDVACGTGVVALTAAGRGAQVTGLDLTPELIAVARDNSAMAGLAIDWHEGDAEQLPFPSESFDVVVSQFGHMFAPRPDVVLGEMLRVLKPGGMLAFSTWPPELYTGRMFALTARYMPPLPEGIAPPPLWGNVNIVRERLGERVRDIMFDRGTMEVPAMSLAHYRDTIERTAGPVLKLVESLSKSDPAKLAEFRGELEALAAQYYTDNIIRQDYLMTRGVKA